MSISIAIEQLKEALRVLPGVGPKNAQRMAFHLLERDKEGAKKIADALLFALEKVRSCNRCNTLCEAHLCNICDSNKRDTQLLCVVETPADLEAIEQSGVYKGYYFVLMGKLSPLEGVGPDMLGFKKLCEIVAENDVKEVVIATNITAEGEATADYTQKLLANFDVKISRLARGVPVGGELEYLDQRTLATAFTERRY